LGWILVLLTTYTRDLELQAIIAPSLISTLYKSSQHQPAMSSPAVPWQRLLTVEILQLHTLKSSLHGASLLTASFPHRLSYRTNSVAPIIFLITSLHGPIRKHRFQQYLHCCIRIRCSVNVFTETLPRISVVSEPFSSDGCFSGSTLFVFSKYATISIDVI
jgi:hypothetical protein